MDHDDLLNLMERNGFRGVIVPVSRADEVIEEIRNIHQKGAFDKGFFNEWMPPRLNAKPPRSLRNPKSILLISAPACQRRVTFHYKGETHEFIVPPTYGRGDAVRRQVRRLVKGIDEEDRPRLADAIPPLKLLAVRSGLAMYGRNNVTYVPGHGSFHRLLAFYTDVDAPNGQWIEKKALPKCSTCRACISACPTSAIIEDRFLIKAERCLSCMNERTNAHPFPRWVKSGSHNAIVGCMTCQRVCPYNREFLDDIEDGPSFSEEDTAYILRGKYSGKRAAAIRRKLNSAGVDMSILPRNLEALLSRPRSK